jgi:two-component system cell cycle sensor histidine kinase/response regulator CckA
MGINYPNEQLHILLVDDDEDDYLITRDLLEDIGGNRYQLDWVDTYQRALKAIKPDTYDVYLIDYRLGSENGLELLRWAIANDIETPMIMLTGQGDHHVDLEAMEAGAADYLVKGQFDAQLLDRSIRYAIEHQRSRMAQIQLEAELRQSQKMEAIGHMAGGIAHDFNNVLTAILTYASLARREVTPDHPVYRKLQGIEETSQRAANLTHQLLAFARRQVTTPKILDLNSIVLKLDKLLRRLITANIELVTLPMPDLGAVKMDPGQLEQVIVNLVVNARDAMPGGGKLTIRTANTTLDETYTSQYIDLLPGDYVCLSISDTGIGMTKELRSRIFEPFFTTKERDKGTGLGLATCYGIIKQNGGHIGVISEPDNGSVFNIYLPQVSSKPAPEVPGEMKSDIPRGTETILLVEDEPSVRQLLTELLRQQGYTVLTAVNGEDALQQYEAHDTPTIDLLLTDLVMPRLGGTGLAEQLKSRCPQLKVAFMSGYADESISQQDANYLETTFIQKPFTIESLALTIRHLLDERVVN